MTHTDWAPSAPPMPPNYQYQGQNPPNSAQPHLMHGQQGPGYQQNSYPPAHPGPVQPVPAQGRVDVAVQPLEAAPWVKKLGNWFTNNTSGVARVDLRRPTLPYPEQYKGNLLFANYKQPVPVPQGWRRQNRNNQGGQGRGRQQAYQQNYQGTTNGYQFHQADVRGNFYDDSPPAAARSGPPTGARVKIMRSFLMWKDKNNHDGKPMLDIGGGINIDMDRQRVEPVLRMKLGGVLSIKAAPSGILKLSKMIPLANTGMGLKVHYELPIAQMHNFYRPPARLMVRLDQLPGAGVRLTPTGLELDQTSLKFGQNITLRAAVGLNFPRYLPIDPENDDFGLKVHRLSMKALW